MCLSKLDTHPVFVLVRLQVPMGEMRGITLRKDSLGNREQVKSTGKIVCGGTELHTMHGGRSVNNDFVMRELSLYLVQL